MVVSATCVDLLRPRIRALSMASIGQSPASPDMYAQVTSGRKLSLVRWFRLGFSFSATAAVSVVAVVAVVVFVALDGLCSFSVVVVMTSVEKENS